MRLPNYKDGKKQCEIGKHYALFFAKWLIIRSGKLPDLLHSRFDKELGQDSVDAGDIYDPHYGLVIIYGRP